MKHLYLSLFTFCFLSLALTAQGQNLVLNPSFEEYTDCPSDLDQVNKTNGWSGYLSPDFIHICSTHPYTSVPDNYFGNQYPFNIGDSAYCGLATFDIGAPNNRELIRGQLNNPLSTGIKYFVSFKVSAAYRGIFNDILCFSNKIGIRFSTDSIPPPINNFAHIYTESIITDTINWVTISGSFVADSAYQNIFIGNFFDDNNTDTICLPSSIGAYYYVDNICVSSDSNICNFGTGNKEVNLKQEIVIYPNPATSSVTIKINPEIRIEKGELKIYNVLGEEVNTIEINSSYVIFNVNNLATGIYLLKMVYKNNLFTQKLTINH